MLRVREESSGKCLVRVKGFCLLVLEECTAECVLSGKEVIFIIVQD